MIKKTPYYLIFEDVKSYLISKGIKVKESVNMINNDYLYFNGMQVVFIKKSYVEEPKVFISISKNTDKKASCVYLTIHYDTYKGPEDIFHNFLKEKRGMIYRNYMDFMEKYQEHSFMMEEIEELIGS
jgi:hypothetical protein